MLRLHRAGLQRQTGTVPTERAWEGFSSFFPKEARRLSLSQFQIFAFMGFLRFNTRHLAKKGLPDWADQDILLQEKFENFRDVFLRENSLALPSDLVTDILGLYPDPDDV